MRIKFKAPFKQRPPPTHPPAISGDGQRKNHVKGRGEEAPPGVRFSDISVLYGYASSSVTEGAPKYWLALRARREVTDAAWSGLASGI